MQDGTMKPGSALVPFGQRDGAEGDELDLVWDAGLTGSLLVEGRIGTGIGSTMRTLVRHALLYPEGWEAVVIAQTTRYPESVRAALRADARDEDEAQAVLAGLADLLHARHSALQDLGIRDLAALDALGAERPRRILVAVEQPHHYPEVVVRRLGDLARLGRAAGVHVAAIELRPQLLPAPMRANCGARAELPEMMSGRISYSEFGGEPVLGYVRDTGAREIEEF